MKELSIEEKATRYDEALKKAKDMLSYKEVRQEDMEYLFPELKESEDEKVRKEIISAIKEYWPGHTDWIAWLEKQKREEPSIADIVDEHYWEMLGDGKQGEQKPEWIEEDMSMIGRIRSIIEKYAFSQSAVDVNGELCEQEYIDADNWLKSLKDRVLPQPKQEFSEYDEYEIDTILAHLKACLNEYTYSRYEKYLKSLRPLNTWKPSDEQILAINTAINVLGKGTINGKYLIELQEQLKKLREE